MTRIALATASLVLIIVNIISIGMGTEINRSHNQTLKAKTVIIECEQVMSLLKDVEIGHRGYTFTGERNFLAPYSTAKSEISFAVQKLKNDTVDIEQKVNRMLTILANSVELKKQDKRTEKECLQDAADAKVIMDNLREEVKQIELDKEKDFQKERDRVTTNTVINNFLMVANALLAIALIFLILWQLKTYTQPL